MKKSVLELAQELTLTESRREVAIRLAAIFGAQDLIVFIKDSTASVLLPALGFTQTLPNSSAWFRFVDECAKDGEASGKLTHPDRPFSNDDAFGVCAKDGSVVIFLGCKSRPKGYEDLLDVLPILSVIFQGERTLQTERSRVALIRESAQHSLQLAQALDNARRNLQKILVTAQHAQQRAEDAIRVRDEFLSIASHELKTPLTSLLLELQFVAHIMRSTSAQTGLSLEAVTGLESSIAQARRIGALINTLLDSSRIGYDRMKLSFDDVDLIALVGEVVSRFRKSASMAGIILSYAPKTTDLKARIDKLRVEQSVENLLSNAIKYGNSKPVEVVVASKDEFAEIIVKDHGIGIVDCDHERIFNRFERAVSPRSISGLGLGLYITRQIVEAHDGQISVSSELSKGSEFRIRLPIRCANRESNHDVQATNAN